jgi:hypothetical protein
MLRGLRTLIVGREGETSTMLDHDRLGNPLAPPSHELIPWEEAPVRHSYEDVQKKLRAELLDNIETARTTVQQELARLRRTGNSADHHALIAELEHRLNELSGLRADVQRAKSPGALENLYARIAEVTASVGERTAAIATTQAGFTLTAISHAEYQSATVELDRRVAQSYAAEAPHLAYAHDIAKRYGIDITPFTHERKGLESERDEARKKGDKLGERMSDALIAHNTYNTLATELDHIKDPEARRRHLDEMRAQQKIIDERTSATAAQAELDARRKATQQNLSPDEAKSFIERFKNEQLQKLDGRARTQKGADKANEIRRRLSPRDLTSNEHGDETPAAIADLAPHVQTEIQQAASAIRKTEAATDAEMELSAKPTTQSAIQGSSQIKPATLPEQHERVETPKTPKKAEAGKGNAVG